MHVVPSTYVRTQPASSSTLICVGWIASGVITLQNGEAESADAGESDHFEGTRVHLQSNTGTVERRVDFREHQKPIPVSGEVSSDGFCFGQTALNPGPYDSCE